MIKTNGVVTDFAELGSIHAKQDIVAIYGASQYFNGSFYALLLGRVKSITHRVGPLLNG